MMASYQKTPSTCNTALQEVGGAGKESVRRGSVPSSRHNMHTIDDQATYFFLDLITIQGKEGERRPDHLAKQTAWERCMCQGHDGLVLAGIGGSGDVGSRLQTCHLWCSAGTLMFQHGMIEPRSKKSAVNRGVF